VLQAHCIASVECQSTARSTTPLHGRQSNATYLHNISELHAANQMMKSFSPNKPKI